MVVGLSELQKAAKTYRASHRPGDDRHPEYVAAKVKFNHLLSDYMEQENISRNEAFQRIGFK